MHRIGDLDYSSFYLCALCVLCGVSSFCYLGSRSSVPDEVGGVGADDLAVQDVEAAAPLDDHSSEPLQRNGDDLAAEPPRQPAPGGGGGAGADDGDVPLAAVQAGAGQQPLLQGPGEVEPGIGPDVRDGTRR